MFKITSIKGDLADHLKKNGAMHETIACYWFTQATQALAYMHDTVGMAHRQVKIGIRNT